MALLSRVDMAAIIATGKSVVFNGEIYSTEASLPTQEEIDRVYTEGLLIQGPAGPKGDTGDTGPQGPPGEDGLGLVNSVNGISEADIVLTSADIGLGNVDNTSDAGKPVSTAQQTALDLKADEADVTTALAGKQDSLGFTPVPNTRTVNGQALSSNVSVTDANLSTSDVTTNDLSITKHGFAPKAPNDTSKFLRGDGSWAAPGGGAGSTLKWVSTGDTSLYNSTDEWNFLADTGVGTKTVASGELVVGKTYRIKFYGYVSSAGAGNFNFASFNLALGSVSLMFKFGTPTMSNPNNWPFCGEFIVTCRSTGSSGTVMANGYMTFEDLASGAEKEVSAGLVATSTATVDTTISNTFSIAVTNNATGAARGATITNATIEALN